MDDFEHVLHLGVLFLLLNLDMCLFAELDEYNTA